MTSGTRPRSAARAELTAQGHKDQGMGEARMDTEKAKDAVDGH
ncbi:hypothetical protein [Curtobacterium sp. MCBD17_021]|nr:hypothetical protein [Curtobacterium sp. MCBD17_021]